MYFFVLFFLVFGNAGATDILSIAGIGTDVDTCKVDNPKKTVYIFKQWHLPPNEKTDITTGRFPEQEENQTAIYQILDNWIRDQNITTVFAEGCEGEITETFPKTYNGWNYSNLKKELNNPNYARITSHIPLKLEVKYTNKLKTLCADDEALIEKSNLYFSDIRGFAGFSIRISQLKNKPTEQESYLKLATEILKIPVKTPSDTVLKKLKDEMQERIVKIKVTIGDRNKVFVRNIKKHDGPSVLVIGGAHLPDLKEKLEKENIGCRVLQTKGYKYDPEALFKALGV